MIRVHDTYARSEFVGQRVVRIQRVVKLFGLTLFTINTEENA